MYNVKKRLGIITKHKVEWPAVSTINRQIDRLRIVFVIWKETQDNTKTIILHIKRLYMFKCVYKADMTEQ